MFSRLLRSPGEAGVRMREIRPKRGFVAESAVKTALGMMWVAQVSSTSGHVGFESLNTNAGLLDTETCGGLRFYYGFTEYLAR